MKIGYVIGIMNEGGIFMYAILCTSIVAVTIMAHRLYTLWFLWRLDIEKLRGEITAAAQRSDFGRALQLCQGNHPGQVLIRSALLRANRSEKEIRRGVETTSIHELSRYRRGTATLPQLSNLATLLGLLGTIHGLIISFSGMRDVNAAARQAALSKGVAVAFYNTFFGLSVATATIAAFLLVAAKQGKEMTRMEHALASIIDEMVSSPEARKQRSAAATSAVRGEA